MSKKIHFKINNHTFAVEKEELEKALIEKGLSKLNEDTDEKGKMVKQTVKSTIGMVLGLMGIQKPKELSHLDNIQFAGTLAITTLLNSLEDKTLEFEAEEVRDEEK